MATNNYTIDYEDERFASLEAEKKTAMSELEKTYGGNGTDTGLIDEADELYKQKADSYTNYRVMQNGLLDDAAENTVKELEGKKKDAEEDYQKEQKAAYEDYQKQIDPYGVNAEREASAGLRGSGYSETNKAAMYNAYQQRQASARAAFVKVSAEFDRDMAEARLQNNAQKAELAAETLQKRLEILLEGYQYKNSLIAEKAAQKLKLENEYYLRSQDIIAQKNAEYELAEQKRKNDLEIAEAIYENTGLQIGGKTNTKDFFEILNEILGKGEETKTANNSPTYTAKETVPWTGRNDSTVLPELRAAGLPVLDKSKDAEEVTMLAGLLNKGKITEKDAFKYLERKYAE